MNVRTYLSTRADASPLVAVLAIGDLLAIAVFVSIGMDHHGYPPLEHQERFVENVVPFLIGWVVAAVVGGLYTLDAVDWPMRALAWTTPAWILAAVIGQILQGTSSVVFLLVSLAAGGGLIIGWRVLVAVVRSYRSKRRSPT